MALAVVEMAAWCLSPRRVVEQVRDGEVGDVEVIFLLFSSYVPLFFYCDSSSLLLRSRRWWWRSSFLRAAPPLLIVSGQLGKEEVERSELGQPDRDCAI
jgi:hypothetical protein